MPYRCRTGNKMDLRSLKLCMSSKLGLRRVDALFHEVELIIIRSLQSVQQVCAATGYRGGARSGMLLTCVLFWGPGSTGADSGQALLRDLRL
jgi:hypothetical protein